MTMHAKALNPPVANKRGSGRKSMGRVGRCLLILFLNRARCASLGVDNVR